MRVPALFLLAGLSISTLHAAPVLDETALLQRETFWDNEDWDWYKANIPFFDCPDADITTTYYYRWELLTKHLIYGSPDSGYSFTEFLDRPFWSGIYGSISCPAGLQLYESRWLRNATIPADYARYWHYTVGAQPNKYSTWLADATWALRLVHPEAGLGANIRDQLAKNYDRWAARQYVESAGMFWQSGHDDGMEFNINSRQTQDILRGDRGFRPSFNSYMYADAKAIANFAREAVDVAQAELFEKRAEELKAKVQKELWDPKRQFFFPQSSRDETSKTGEVVKVGSLTYQTGKFAGDEHGRELHGYVPWQFNLPDAGKGYEAAWKFLMQPDYFAAPFGPTTLERHDPQFVLQPGCCWWSGQSWPYATSQTLTAMANLLNNYQQDFVDRKDYLELLKVFSLTHRKNGKPYLAEGANPDTGSWAGHDSMGHSNHYFHSNYCDLIITGLVGLRPRADTTVEINPLAPADWPYFALQGVRYHSKELTIFWDKDGSKYKRGAGLTVLSGGETLAHSDKLEKLVFDLSPSRNRGSGERRRAVFPNHEHIWQQLNFAVNNDGTRFPDYACSFEAANAPLSKIYDGNYFYSKEPSNRWTSEGSKNAVDWVEVDFGMERPLQKVKLYLLDDRGASNVTAPDSVKLLSWDDKTKTWQPVGKMIEKPPGHRPLILDLAPGLATQKLRVEMQHDPGKAVGLTELEAWGDGPFKQAPSPKGNLALGAKTSASYTSSFDKTAEACDGIAQYSPEPRNRWTAYDSKSPSDWLEFDLGAVKTFSNMDLSIFDDHGGVRAPAAYSIQVEENGEWKEVKEQKFNPVKPAGGRRNHVSFSPVTAQKVRLVFTHAAKAFSGVTEVEIWP